MVKGEGTPAPICFDGVDGREDAALDGCERLLTCFVSASGMIEPAVDEI